MLTSTQFKDFRNEVNNALKAIAEKYDVNLTAGSISYNENKFTCKLEGKAKEVNGMSFEQAEFEKWCIYYGMKPEHYKKQFSYGGERYELVGFKPKAKKYSVLAKRTDGKIYKMPVEIVKFAIAN